jgi:hypothetical protein
VRLRTAFISACCAGVLALNAPALGQGADPSGTLFEVSLPGDLRGALATLDDAVVPDRSQFLLEVIRRTHNIPTITKTDARTGPLRTLVTHLNEAATSVSNETLPLPLAPDVWRDVVFGGQGTPQTLVTAILQSRDASLLYSGLLSLDDETRAWISTHRSLLADLFQHAPAFAAAAPGLRISDGGVRVPGDEAARPAWEALVGHGAKDAEAFVRTVVGQDEGRLAYFFGSMAGLTAPQIQLAFELDSLEVAPRVDAARRLYGVFERLGPGWRIAERALQRPVLDPALLAADLRVDTTGKPMLPGTRRFWSAVFVDGPVGRIKNGRDEDVTAIADEAPVDLAWLSEQIFSADPYDQRRRYFSVLFASRVLDRVTPGNVRDAIEAVRAVVRYPALIATLERAHIRDIRVLAAAAQRAGQLSTIADDVRMARALGQFQGTLALVTRAALRGSLSTETLATWVSSLCGLEPDERGDYDGKLVKWLDARLRESGAEGSDAPPGLSDRNLVNLIAGRASAQPPIVEWEGTRYRVDLVKAETTRLDQLLGDDFAPLLSSARDVVGVADALEGSGLTPDRLREQAGVFDRSTRAAALDVPDEGDETDLHRRYRDLAARLERLSREADLRDAPHLSPDLRVLADDLAARGLAQLVYAAAMGQRERTAITAGDAARRHEFGLRSAVGRRAAPWLFPTAGSGTRGWRVSGSLLGLDLELAELSLLPLSSKPPTRRPTLGDDDRRAMTEAVALVEPLALTDRDRDAIVAAIQKGRSRVAAIRTTADAVSLADEIRLSPARRSLLPWIVRHDPTRVAAFFSPSELFWLGGEASPLERRFDAWGAPGQPRLGCQCLQMLDRRPWEQLSQRWSSGIMISSFSDLNLRLAERLAELHMPAALLGPVLASASLDFINNVITRDADDHRGLVEFVNALRTDRVELYLALLTTDGPLVPIGDGSAPADKEAPHR